MIKLKQSYALILFIVIFFWACDKAGAKNSTPLEFTVVFATGNHGETDPCG